MCNFFPASEFKWIDPQEVDLNKHTSNSSIGCVLEVDIEYPKQSQELHNDYPLAPNQIEIKREILPEYQLKIAYLNFIPVGNITN